MVLAFLLSAGNSQGKEKHLNEAETQNRGSKSYANPVRTPFMIIVQPAPVKVIQQSTSHGNKQNQQKWYQRPSITDWGIPGVSFFYAIISLGLLNATRKQAKLAVIGAEAAKANAEAAKQQANIANKALLLQFRPRLIVRNFVVQPHVDVGEHGPIYYFVRNHFVHGQCFVANVGDSAATITESFCKVYWLKGPLPMRRPYEGQDAHNPISGRVEAGDRRTLSFNSDEPLNIGHTEIGLMGYPDFKPVWSVYVMGWIEYKDDLGFERRTSFCRKFEPTINRFVPINDPDYENQE
jgi:hypothetical protein